MKKVGLFYALVYSLLILTVLTLSNCADLLPTAAKEDTVATIAAPTNVQFEQVPPDSGRIIFRGNNTEDDFAGYVLFDLSDENESEPSPVDSIILNKKFTGDTAFSFRYDQTSFRIWAVAARDTAGDLSQIVDISSNNQTAYASLKIKTVYRGAGKDGGLDIDADSFDIVDVQRMDNISGFSDGGKADLVFTLSDSTVVARAVNGAVLVYMDTNSTTRFSSKQCDSIRTIASSYDAALFLGKYRVASSGQPIVTENDTMEARPGDSYMIISKNHGTAKEACCGYITIRSVAEDQILFDLRR